MPRTTTPDPYGLTAINHAVILVTTSNGASVQTDTARLNGYRPDQQRARVGTRHGESMAIYNDEIDEVIALLMRYRAQMPDTAIPAPTTASVEEEIF